MASRSRTRLATILGWVLLGLAVAPGCQGLQSRRLEPPAAAVEPQPPPMPPPHELMKVNLPDYVIEPPDVLQLDVLYAVPKPPYHVQSLDSLLIRVVRVLPEEPIAGVYQVDPEGTVNLGPSYGTVQVAGLTLPEVKAEIERMLRTTGLKEPQADVAVAQTRSVQQVRGPHLVRPDGTVGLGTYGSVRVTGLTLAEAKAAIEGHLSQFLQGPEVSVDVTGFNSKVFYVVYDMAGAGQQVYRLPLTGNDTVLDAVSQLYGLSVVADLHRVWIARPTYDKEHDLVLPVDWKAVASRGRTETNYQLMPGDRLYVASDRWVHADLLLSRRLNPFERIFGFSILGVGAIRALQFQGTTGTGTTTGR